MLSNCLIHPCFATLVSFSCCVGVLLDDVTCLCASSSALVWQLMKAYTLSVLTKLSDPESNHPIADREIIAWVNDKLKSQQKTSKINGFNDPVISNGVVVLDLVDAIKPGSVKYDLVKAGNTEQVRQTHVFVDTVTSLKGFVCCQKALL